MTIKETAKLFEDMSSLWPGKVRFNDESRAALLWQGYFANVPADTVKQALKAYLMNGSPFAPSAAELMAGVIEIVRASYLSDEQAYQKIHYAVCAYGRNGMEQAREELTAPLFSVVDAVGGWKAVCEGVKPSDIKAAWHTHVTAEIKRMVEGTHETGFSD